MKSELYLREYLIVTGPPGNIRRDAIRAPGPGEAALAWCRWYDETMCDRSSELLCAPAMPHLQKEAHELVLTVAEMSTGQSWDVRVRLWLEPRYEVAHVSS